MFDYQRAAVVLFSHGLWMTWMIMMIEMPILEALSCRVISTPRQAQLVASEHSWECDLSLSCQWR
jgi:hypothetical protein